MILRIAAITASCALFVAVIVWCTWYLSFGITRVIPSHVEMPGITAQVMISWSEDDLPVIRAEQRSDAFAALGFAQATSHYWQMALWRQTALGRVSEWFGEPAASIDKTARRLGFAATARSAYEGLSDEDRAPLDAFAHGVNAAARSRPVAQTDELVLFDIVPEPWEGWHSLLIERLIAWMATSSGDAGPHQQFTPSMDLFLRDDRLFRSWLHLHGFEHSTIWTRQASDVTDLFQRHVYGRAALPIFSEATLIWPGREVVGASLIGTPIFPVGQSDTHSWSILLTGSAEIGPLPIPTSIPARTDDRIHMRDGSEEIFSYRRSDAHLYVEEPLITVRSLDDVTPQRIHWAGFSQDSDWPTWLKLLEERGEPNFRLLSGVGVLMDSQGRVTPMGRPETRRSLPDGMIVSESTWLDDIADRLREVPADTILVNDESVLYDTYSAWAASAAPWMIAAAEETGVTSRQAEEALEYLRNWDFSFDRTSIGATIFETWAVAYAEVGGRPGANPPPPSDDSLSVIENGSAAALAAAIDLLTQKAGTDMSRWRWEDIQPSERMYPVFSDSSLLPFLSETIARTRFAPLRTSGGGHPSALRWGPSSLDSREPASASWAAWMSSVRPNRMVSVREDVRVRGFLARYMMSGRQISPITIGLSTDTDRATTLLTPTRP